MVVEIIHFRHNEIPATAKFLLELWSNMPDACYRTSQHPRLLYIFLGLLLSSPFSIQYTLSFLCQKRCELVGNETVITHNLQSYKGALAIFLRVSSSFWILEGNLFLRLSWNCQDHVKNWHTLFKVLALTPIFQFWLRRIEETFSTQQNVRNGQLTLPFVDSSFWTLEGN